MKSRLNIAVCVLMSIFILSNVLSIFMMVDYKLNVEKNIKSEVSRNIKDLDIDGKITREADKNVRLSADIISPSVKSEIDKLDIYNYIKTAINDKINSLNIKNGVDGSNGTNGKDSISTITVEKTIEQIPFNGNDGLTPQIRCNTTDNRWEIKYSEFDSWSFMNGEIVSCKGV